MKEASGPRETTRQIQARDLVPAPYLADASSLPAELAGDELPPDQERRAQRFLSRLKRELFQRRRDYEIETGVKIVPEPPPVL